MTYLEKETYLVLRHGGASQARACTELGVNIGRGRMLEKLLRIRRPGEGTDCMRPRFARHKTHVAAVRAAGGYPTLRP